MLHSLESGLYGNIPAENTCLPKPHPPKNPLLKFQEFPNLDKVPLEETDERFDVIQGDIHAMP